MPRILPRSLPAGVAGTAGRQILKQILLLALAFGFVALFADRFRALHPRDIWAAFHSLSAPQWGIALAATAVSFWAVGRYDAVLHRILGTGIGASAARRSGISAIALSQTLGFGLLTGAVVRWRLLPGLDFWQAMRLSALVAVTFLAGWAVVLGAALLVLPVHFPHAHILALLPLSAFGAAIWFSLSGSAIAVRGHLLRPPSLRAIRAILILTALDTVAAAGVLHALLPPGSGLDFSSLYPAFLVAFGVGLLSGTPGGVGPFEVTLLALLPNVEPAPLMAATLAYRAIYFALPAGLAMLVLARGPVQRDWPRAGATTLLPVDAFSPPIGALATLIGQASFAEANLLRQGGKSILAQSGGPTRLMVATTGQALVALRDPLRGRNMSDAVRLLQQSSKLTLRSPCFYKCSARLALAARQAGFKVLPIAREAWLTPQDFSLDTPGRRQLRRKLRKAKRGGIRILCSNGPLPLTDMARVNSAWCDANRGERGFSMGRFSLQLLQTQRVYLAYADGCLQGFISLNCVPREWSLDLMRQIAGAADGTMHALLTHALRDAADARCPRFSLASVPAATARMDGDPFGLTSWIMRRMCRSVGASSGLLQFKSSFAPNWQTLYVAAPSKLALALAGLDIARAITRPRAAGAATPTAGTDAMFSSSL